MVFLRFRMLLGFFVATALAVAFMTVSKVPAAHADGGAQAGQFVPMQGRIFDTRNGVGGYSTPMPASFNRTLPGGGESDSAVRTFQVSGASGVPATGVIAVSITMTAVASLHLARLRRHPMLRTSIWDLGCRILPMTPANPFLLRQSFS